MHSMNLDMVRMVVGGIGNRIADSVNLRAGGRKREGTPLTGAQVLGMRPEDLDAKPRLQATIAQLGLPMPDQAPDGLLANGPFWIDVGPIAGAAAVVNTSVGPGSGPFNRSAALTGGTFANPTSQSNALYITGVHLVVRVPASAFAADVDAAIRMAGRCALSFVPGPNTKRRTNEFVDFAGAVTFEGTNVAADGNAGPALRDGDGGRQPIYKFARFLQPKLVLSSDTLNFIIPPSVVATNLYGLIVQGALVVLANNDSADALYPECAPTVGESMSFSLLNRMSGE